MSQVNPSKQAIFDAFIDAVGPEKMWFMAQDIYSHIEKAIETNTDIEEESCLRWRAANSAIQAKMFSHARIHFNWLATHATIPAHKTKARDWLEKN